MRSDAPIKYAALASAITSDAASPKTCAEAALSEPPEIVNSWRPPSMPCASLDENPVITESFRRTRLATWA